VRRLSYATWSLAAGISLFTLSRRMGTSLAMIDATYGHLAPDAEERERELLDGTTAVALRLLLFPDRALEVVDGDHESRKQGVVSAVLGRPGQEQFCLGCGVVVEWHSILLRFVWARMGHPGTSEESRNPCSDVRCG
jgi:hypothetical protein